MTHMHYSIRHITKFIYEVPITESVMEVRMQPRSEGSQRCLRFGLSTLPSARVKQYLDHDGNVVHHFNIPSKHGRLTLTAEALVECGVAPALPEAVDAGWEAIDRMTASGEFWELLNPSPFARPTALLSKLADEIGVERGADPMKTLTQVMTDMYSRFEYSPQTTRVDSPIDDALQARRGVCQDFAHIYIALARGLGVPARYVSGYLFHRDRGDRSADGATHAWVEVCLPGIGWMGLDPTNNLIAGDRHIRVAIGRDYADVPPTRGVFKGASALRSELAVAVTVGRAQPGLATDVPFVPWMSQDAIAVRNDADSSQQ